MLNLHTIFSIWHLLASSDLMKLPRILVFMKCFFTVTVLKNRNLLCVFEEIHIVTVNCICVYTETFGTVSCTDCE